MPTFDGTYDISIELAPDPVFVVDSPSGVLREVSERAASKLGYGRDRLTGMDVMELHPEEQTAAYRSLFEQIRSEGRVRTDTLPGGDQIHLVTRTGRQIPVELHAQTIPMDGATGVYSIARDITERKRHEEHLETQRNLLDLLNQIVRHDLRNDLQVVGTYAELLEDHVDEDAMENLERMQESTTNAVEFTETAGDLAEIIRDPDAERERISLAALLDRQCDEIRELHPEATVEVESDCPDVAVMATEMLDSVFRNLLQNAIQHNNAETPRVAVSVERIGDTVETRVSDNGPGIPDDRKAEIFGYGEQGLASNGTGLGLYLARTLVERYNGDIRVEDNDPQGAVFVVRLPAAD